MLRSVKYKNRTIEYELRQTQRKSIECRVTPGRATVFAPLGLPVREADEFVLRQAEWILAALEKAGERAGAALEQNERCMQEGAPIPIEGKAYRLHLADGKRMNVRLEGDQVIVSGAQGDPLKIRAALREYLIGLAKARFEERVKFHAARIGVRPKGVTLREQKTKWGSCSSLGNLNFNWKLIMAEPGALDYVVVHELCHLIELNHSPAFWAQVEKHRPDWKKWRDYLKNGIKGPF